MSLNRYVFRVVIQRADGTPLKAFKTIYEGASAVRAQAGLRRHLRRIHVKSGPLLNGTRYKVGPGRLVRT